MIKHNGYEYEAKVTIKAVLKFSAHDDDEAVDNIEEMLNDMECSSFKVKQWWYDVLEAGDEALDVTEDDD